MDCGNNPCDFAVDLRGQRTAGRCRCWDSLPKMDPETRVAVRRTAAELRAALATERAGREEAEALVVWCAERDLRARMAVDGTHYIEWTPEGSDGSDVLDESYDGTDAGLRAAVRKGREGK